MMSARWISTRCILGRKKGSAATALVALLMALSPATGRCEPAADPQGYIDALRAELAGYAQDGPSRNLTAVLQLGQQLTKDPQALMGFRNALDVAAVSRIAAAASSKDRPLRVTAARLLIDLIDNRTMCAVADKLMADELDADAQYNFLQILRIANRYAMAENRAWNAQAVSAVTERLPKEGFAKTRNLLATLGREQADLASPANLIILASREPGSFAGCSALPNIARLAAENRSVSLYLHTGRTSQEIDALSAGLQAAGFVVKGTDKQEDLVGGPGIDYPASTGNSEEVQPALRDKADTVGSILAAVVNVTIAPRPQNGMAGNTLGVWF